MRRTWESSAAMGRVMRTSATVATVTMAFGLIALLLQLPFAVPAFIIGTTAIAIALFAGFRASHLREMRRDT